MSDSNGNDLDLAQVPGLVRIAVTTAVRTAGWTASAYLKVLSRATGTDLNALSRRFVAAAGGAVNGPVEAALGQRVDEQPRRSQPREGSLADLRMRGEELLARSADVSYDEEAHPAYARILSELAPDEGRILRLLAISGPQPSVDVRTAPPLGIGSQLAAPGLTMIGAEAGVRHGERVPAYLNNLFRLGLVWFSREPVPDQLRYQVLEAQPEVTDAMRSAGRSRTVRRSIGLTPFGEDFCVTCLPVHTAELELLPGAATLELPAAQPPPRT